MSALAFSWLFSNHPISTSETIPKMSNGSWNYAPSRLVVLTPPAWPPRPCWSEVPPDGSQMESPAPQAHVPPAAQQQVNVTTINNCLGILMSFPRGRFHQVVLDSHIPGVCCNVLSSVGHNFIMDTEIGLILISWNTLKETVMSIKSWFQTNWSFYAQTSKICNMNKRFKTETKRARRNTACCPSLKRKASKKSSFTNYEETVVFLQKNRLIK